MGARAREVVARDYDRDLLLGRFADLIEQRLGLLDPR